MFDFESLSQLAYIKQITLDLSDTSKKYLTTKQNDLNSRYLEIVITENLMPIDIPENTSVLLRGTKPNGNIFLDNGAIADNKIYVDLTNAITCAGRVKCDICLTDLNSSISTVTFYLEVLAQPFDENAVVDSDQFSALEAALVKVNNAIIAYTVQQTYDPTSASAQSGKAVAEAIEESLGAVNNVLATLVEVE